jgi:hypothetical protein
LEDGFETTGGVAGADGAGAAAAEDDGGGRTIVFSCRIEGRSTATVAGRSSSP